MENRSIRPGADGEAVVAGTGGSGNIIPVAAARFHPVAGQGGKVAIGAASVNFGPLPHGKAIHFFTDTVCWVNTGGAAVVAASGDTPIQNGPVYEYTATDATDDYIAIIRDTADGNIWYGQAEL